MIETTININREMLKEINDAAELLGMSRSAVIVSLLKMVMDKDIEKCQVCRAVKYQDAADKCSWKKFHISLKEYDYEYFLDLRKFLKMSVSYLVAYAVKKYLSKIIHPDKADNYQFVNYIFYTGIKHNYRYWTIIWGVPGKYDENPPEIL